MHFCLSTFVKHSLGYSIIVNYEQDQKGMTSEGSYIRRMYFTNYFYSLNGYKFTEEGLNRHSQYFGTQSVASTHLQATTSYSGNKEEELSSSE